jgi:hypothetical protein
MAAAASKADIFGHGGGMDFGGGTVTRKGTSGPQFGPLHGNAVPGAANPNFRLKPDWQKAKIIKAASGMHETVSSPTWILAGEAGKERVDIGQGGGGGSTHITISFQPSEFKQFLRYTINEDQGYQK